MVAKSNLRSSSMSFRPSIVVIQVMECGVIRSETLEPRCFRFGALYLSA